MKWYRPSDKLPKQNHADVIIVIEYETYREILKCVWNKREWKFFHSWSGYYYIPEIVTWWTEIKLPEFKLEEKK